MQKSTLGRTGRGAGTGMHAGGGFFAEKKCWVLTQKTFSDLYIT